MNQTRLKERRLYYSYTAVLALLNSSGMDFPTYWFSGVCVSPRGILYPVGYISDGVRLCDEESRPKQIETMERRWDAAIFAPHAWGVGFFLASGIVHTAKRGPSCISCSRSSNLLCGIRNYRRHSDSNRVRDLVERKWGMSAGRRRKDPWWPSVPFVPVKLPSESFLNSFRHKLAHVAAKLGYFLDNSGV